MDSIKFNNYKNRYAFKLEVDYDEQKINIIVKVIDENKFSEIAYYDFETIEKVLKHKHKSTAYIEAKNEKREDGEYFKFEKMQVYYNISFNKFLDLLEEGKIVYDIRIGTYGTGKDNGKPHDHGSGFRCNSKIFDELFEYKTTVD